MKTAIAAFASKALFGILTAACLVPGFALLMTLAAAGLSTALVVPGLAALCIACAAFGYWGIPLCLTALAANFFGTLSFIHGASWLSKKSFEWMHFDADGII